MGEPVQQGGGHGGIAEHLGPIRKTKVRGNHHRSSFMPFGQDLKQQLRALLGEGDVAEFVQDQQIVADILLNEALQCPLLPCLDQLVDQPAAAHKAATEVVLAGLDAQRSDQVSLTSATSSQEMTFLLSRIYPPAVSSRRSRISNSGAAAGSNISRSSPRELRLPHPALQAAVCPGLQFGTGQLNQKLLVPDATLPGLPQSPFHLTGHMGRFNALRFACNSISAPAVIAVARMPKRQASAGLARSLRA